MHPARFDDLTRAFLSVLSRRRVAGLAGLGLAGLPLLVETKKKRKKKKKVKKNEFGCVNVGGRCRGKDANCCSGICQGKKPKKGKKDKSRCVAHDESTCQTGQSIIACGAAEDVLCTTSAGVDGRCITTTGNAGYCFTIGTCVACSKDADCEPLCGEGAACIKCEGECAPEGGTGCASLSGAGCAPV